MPIDAIAIELRYTTGSKRAAIAREILAGYSAERIAGERGVSVAAVKRLRQWLITSKGFRQCRSTKASSTTFSAASGSVSRC